MTEEEMRAEVERAHRRANEAARLSAAARDEADDLRKTIANLREQIDVVEYARTERDLWAVNLIAEHGIDCELAGDPYDAVARYIRDQKDALAEYRHVVDKSIAVREQALRRLDDVAELIHAPLGGDR